MIFAQRLFQGDNPMQHFVRIAAFASLLRRRADSANAVTAAQDGLKPALDQSPASKQVEEPTVVYDPLANVAKDFQAKSIELSVKYPDQDREFLFESNYPPARNRAQ